jgi:hypothetical protein
MRAATSMAWAEFHSWLAHNARNEGGTDWAHHLDNMYQSIASALELVGLEASPLLRAKYAIDAATLSQTYGTRTPVTPNDLTVVARQCLKHGYGGQARHLLELPQVQHLLPEDVLAALQERFGVQHTDR